MTNSSRAGLGLIKTFEGCRLQAYKCPAGVWTIGYGRTTDVKPGDTCTQEQADQWLAEEYDAFEREVLNLIKVPLTENQLGALVSFTYNLGARSLKESTLRRLLNDGGYEGAAGQFARWNRAGGRVLKGLVRRRAAEMELFLTP